MLIIYAEYFVLIFIVFPVKDIEIKDYGNTVFEIQDKVEVLVTEISWSETPNIFTVWSVLRVFALE